MSILKSLSADSDSDDLAQIATGSVGERFDALRSEIQQLKTALHGSKPQIHTDSRRAEVTLERVREHIALRASRNQLFGSTAFAEPAFDLLLFAYAAAIQSRVLSVSEFYSSVDMPNSTAHRWLSKLEKDGLLERQIDLFDGRLKWLKLTDKAFHGLNAYFKAL